MLLKAIHFFLYHYLTCMQNIKYMSDKNVNILELVIFTKRIEGGSRLFNLYGFISCINFVLLLTQINLTIRTITIRHNIIRNVCIDV